MVSPPLGRLELSDNAVVQETSGIDNDIDRAELRNRLLKDGLHVALFDDVACGHEGVALELSGCVLELLCVTADENNSFGADFGPGLRDSLR